jgi:hypothetical protein
MSRKYRRVQFPVLVAAALVVIVGVAALVKIEHTADADFWVSGAAVLVPLVLGVGGKTLRKVKTPSRSELDKQVDDLREELLEQWKDEVRQRIFGYPLPVPFSVTTVVELPVPTTGTYPARVPVMDSWSTILEDPLREPPDIDGTFKSITDVFRTDGLNNRLVVLGDPGSGKSILAQWLTLKLLEVPSSSAGAAQEGPSKAIPVLLQLRTWDPAVALRDWAAVQMTHIYPWLSAEIQVRGGTSRTLASQLIEQGRVLMVLDGLDEITPENRLAAFRKLSEVACTSQAMVITCRAREYAQMVYQAGQPLPQMPVIRLNPLPLPAVCTRLMPENSPSPRFRRLAGRMELNPDGPLARALSSPLALWLVTTVYHDPGRDPMELAGFKTRDEILAHLLHGLVGAVYTASYSMPTGNDLTPLDEDAVEVTRERLTRIADYLGPSPACQSIDWWRLPAIVPGPFVGGVIGTVVGCLLGAAIGLAAATRFGSRSGILLGVIFGIVTGVLSGVTSVRPQERPRTVDIQFSWDYWRFVGCLTVGVGVGLTAGYADHRGGGLLVGLITAAVAGPACAVPCVVAFGWAPGITAGFTASVALGLSSGLSKGSGHPIWSGFAAGAVFLVSAWIFVGLFQPAKDKYVVSPQSLLDRDRGGSLIVAGTAGVAFAVVYGIALGPVFALVALVALTVAVSLTVSMWGAFNVSRVWLAKNGMFPLTVMSFLNDAYVRGVLRQVGGSYQFRHTELKEALLTPDDDGRVEVEQPEWLAEDPVIVAGSAAERAVP